jgi:Holliday junction resolvase RusA-like endonuclease
MNEIRLILAGIIGLVIIAIILWYTHMPETLEDKDIDIIIAISVGLLILVVDKRQERHLHDISLEQHKMIGDIHNLIKEQMDLITELHMKSKDVKKAK